MKKTLFVLSYSHLGGAETRAVDLAINLKNSLIPVFVVYGKPNGDVQKVLGEKGISCITRKKFSWNRKSKLSLLWALFSETVFLLKIYVKERPASVISFCADANIFVFLMNCIVRNKKTYWCQVDDFLQWRWKRLLQFSARKSVCMIAVSEYIAEQITRKTGRKPDRITMIPNRINPNKLKKDKTKSSQIRISVVGHINPNKNQGFVIEAVRGLLMNNTHTNMELNLYGHITDTSYWNSINTEDVWLNYRGYKDKNYIYNHTDLVVIASHSEASSLVLQEALYFGLTVLCADLPVFKFHQSPQIKKFSLTSPENLTRLLQEVLLDFREDNQDKTAEYQEKYEEYISAYKELLM